MILDIYKDSFEFASKKVTNLIILGVLSLFGFLIIPSIIVCGYNYKVIEVSTESMINGGYEPPEIENFKSLFIDGLKYIVVSICYAIIPLVIIIASLFYYTNTTGVLIGLILFIIAQLYSYLAIANMANNRSISAAFNLKELNKIMKSIGYLRYFLTYVGVNLIKLAVIIIYFIIVFIILASLGMSIPMIGESVSYVMSYIFAIVGFAFVFIIQPYLSIFTSRCYGLIYNIRE